MQSFQPNNSFKKPLNIQQPAVVINLARMAFYFWQTDIAAIFLKTKEAF